MSATVEQSMSLSRPLPPHYSWIEKISIAIGSIGLLLLLVAFLGQSIFHNTIWLIASLSLMSLGTIAFSMSRYLSEEPGIKNNGVWFSSLSSKGIAAWILGIVLTGFYCFLYWNPELLGLNEGGNTGLVGFFDPLSEALKGKPASEWFVYGTLYTVAILIFGVKFILKYRHNRYQIIRTLSVMFFQLAFAYLIPEIMASFNMPYNDFKNMWPLNYYFFFDWNIKQMLAAGTLGLFMLVWGIVLFLVISPILTYFFGKRWYCSWVCGCGGLAETAGDPFRHLSDKSTRAWKIERWMIHSVLVFAVVMTVAVLFTFFHNEPNKYWLDKTSFSIIVLVFCAIIAGFVFSRRDAIRRSFKNLDYIIWGILLFISVLTIIALITGAANPFFIDAYRLREWYGFLIGAAFSGVIGVGFYPLLGSRVWCRYGCPLAAILGVQQKFFSKFRITTNGGQCISCGNCSTYCEMGIDVRAYAQKGQNIVRASCVGCGICAAVCPRGVLKLENGSIDIFEKTSAKRTVHVREEEVFVKF